MNERREKHFTEALIILLTLLLLTGILPWITSSVHAGNGGLVGANIKDGKLIGYYGDGGDIIIPNTVTSIEAEAFKGNDNVTSVTIPGSVQSIGYSAFEGCSALTRVTFSDPKDGAELTIRVSAFLDCPKLSEITIPAVCRYVTGNVFKGCNSLKEIGVDPDNPYYFAKDGVLFGPNVIEGSPQYDDTAHYTLIAYPAGKAAGTYEIPSSVNGRSVDRIWASAFRKCGSLTGVKIPSTVEEIGGNAFEETGLREIEIPGTVKSIGAGVFENCKNLTDVTLPDTVTELAMSFFDGCTSLQRIKMDNVKTIGIYAFRDCQSLTNLILPEGLSSITSSSVFDGCSNLERVYIPASVINFPSDDTLGAFDIFQEASDDLLVYVIKDSTGEKYAVNNAKGFGWNYKVISSKADLASQQDGPFSLIDMGRKIKVTETFSMGSSLKVNDVSSANEKAFQEAAGENAYKAYSIGLLPENIQVPESMDLAMGIPSGIQSKDASLYRIENGKAVNTDASSASKTLKKTVTSLGDFAVIGKKDSSGTPDEPAEPSSITLNRSEASVKVGKTITLSSTILPENTKNRTVTWTSSDESIASVDKGVVKGISPGNAVITASTSNGKTAKCEVTVVDGSEISASSLSLRAPKKADEGGSLPFSLILKDPSRIAALEVTFLAEDIPAEEAPTVTGKNGFQLLGSPKKNDDGTYTAVLSYLEEEKLFSRDGAQEIAAISVKGDTPSLTLKDAKITGWKMDEISAYGTIASIDHGKITYKPLSRYDFNEDGNADQNDLEAAEKHYRAEKQDKDYDQVKIYDVNEDGVIDIEDFVIIQHGIEGERK